MFVFGLVSVPALREGKPCKFPILSRFPLTTEPQRTLLLCEVAPLRSTREKGQGLGFPPLISCSKPAVKQFSVISDTKSSVVVLTTDQKPEIRLFFASLRLCVKGLQFSVASDVA